MGDVLKVKLSAVIALLTITIQQAHNIVGFLTAVCALLYSSFKLYFLIRDNKIKNKN